MIAGRLANMRSGTRTDLASIEARSHSQTEAAKLLNVSRSSVQRAKIVLQHGTPEEIKSVEQGEAAVSADRQGGSIEPASQSISEAADPK